MAPLDRGSRRDGGAPGRPHARDDQRHQLLRGPGAAGRRHVRGRTVAGEGAEPALQEGQPPARCRLHPGDEGQAPSGAREGSRRHCRGQPDHHRGPAQDSGLLRPRDPRSEGDRRHRARCGDHRQPRGPLGTAGPRPKVEQLLRKPPGLERRFREEGPRSRGDRPRRRAPRDRGHPGADECRRLPHHGGRRLHGGPLESGLEGHDAPSRGRGADRAALRVGHSQEPAPSSRAS